MASVVRSVAMITSQQATSAVLPAKVRPFTTATSGTSPLNRENCVKVGVSKATPGPVLSSPGLPPPPSPNRGSPQGLHAKPRIQARTGNIDYAAR